MMEILSYSSDDFEMTVGCHHLKSRFAKASKKITNIELAANYQVTGNQGNLKIWSEQSDQLTTIENGENSYPVFFENTDYIFDIAFSKDIYNPIVLSRLKNISEKFIRKKRITDLYTLTGTLNYRNEIGKFDFILQYEKNGVKQEFTLEFEVFPIKLDFKRDYKKIVSDIENEYSNLVLDFLKKTYSDFKPNQNNNTDLIWWSLFSSIYNDIFLWSKFLLNKPHTRLIKFENYLPKEGLKKLSPWLEEQIIIHGNNPGHLFPTTSMQLTIDTTENRFFKYVIRYSHQKFLKIHGFIIRKKGHLISKELSEELTFIENQLTILVNHPFFRRISEFKGIHQESMVLHKKSGYSVIYKNWILLKKGVKLFEGVQKIELKNMADLYQIWCFIRMKGMIQSIVGKEPDKYMLAELNEDFVYSFKTDKSSQATFITEDGSKVELFHEYLFGTKTGNENLSFTVKQKPDIVLQITKYDLKDDYKFTYLYDAKYRLQSDEDDTKPDCPPNDAINQMHQYRDAIYYFNKAKKSKAKEIIGAYILFPGAGTLDDIKKEDYQQAIAQINIGAFPLLPNDVYDSKQLLETHLKEILGKQSESILEEVIPQKGMAYQEIDEYVLAGFASKKSQIDYLKSDEAEFYHMPVPENTLQYIERVKYFAPIINGIEEYFQITAIGVLPRNKIYPPGHILYKDSTELYFVFRISNRQKLEQRINTAPGGNRVFRYAKLSELRSCVNINEFNKIKVDEG